MIANICRLVISSKVSLPESIWSRSLLNWARAPVLFVQPPLFMSGWGEVTSASPSCSKIHNQPENSPRHDNEVIMSLPCLIYILHACTIKQPSVKRFQVIPLKFPRSSSSRQLTQHNGGSVLLSGLLLRLEGH